MDYIAFVEEQIKKFRKSVDVIEAGEISPVLVYHNLAVYSDINLSLNSEYQRYKSEYKRILREFNMWFDERFVKVRREMNDIKLPASKWASKQEIESETRVQNKEEFLTWKDRLDEAEDRMEFFRRLLDQWKAHAYILQTLSDNIRQEMKSLSLESYTTKKSAESSYPPQQESRRRRVQ